MFSQPEVESTSPTHKINEQALYTAGISVSYITLAIGYLLGILQANHLTLLNFLALTLLQVSYCALLVWLIQFDPPRWQSTLCISAQTFITIGSGMVSIIGIQFDWLIYLVTISIYFQSFSIRTSTILTILLYLAMGINLSFINNWQWYYVVSWSSPMLTLLPAFVFVAAFSLTVRVLGAQRDRAEQLLGQLVTSNTEVEQAHKQLQEYANE